MISPVHRLAAPDLTEQLRKATHYLVATAREHGLDPDQIRTAVRSAFQGGVTVEAPASTWATFLACEDDVLVDPSSVYWLVFSQPGVDRGDQVAQETWWRVISAALECAI
jgi:hypothetical protein